jgi:hypothetical protein
MTNGTISTMRKTVSRLGIVIHRSVSVKASGPLLGRAVGIMEMVATLLSEAQQTVISSDWRQQEGTAD